MGECGCTMYNERYTFPGPGEAFYILTLSGGCVYCDAPSGVTLELIEPGNVLWKEYNRGEFIDGKLKFEKWPDSKGVAVITGQLRHEFVKAMTPHLTSIDMLDYLDGDKKLDDIGAETLLEEMYDDATTMPSIVKP